MKTYKILEKLFISSICFTFFYGTAFSQIKKNINKKNEIIPGAWKINKYLGLIKGNSVAIFANATSTIGQTHLVDTLLKLGVNIKKIFSPEHGFRGNEDAGEHISNSVDTITKIPIISLYGDHKKPSKEELNDINAMIFDVQDVGVRFYTYISSLQYYMEAAFENKKDLIILDRPNPNGFYVDGPVLDTNFRSFIGMQPVPIVYGMTIGEYARMLVGESWLSATAMRNYKDVEMVKDPRFEFLVIACDNYTHKSFYEPPIKPSPNLPNIQSILLYPSLCFFEGTDISVGRGTNKPFQCYGHPTFPNTLYSFTPMSIAGAKNPPHKNVKCYGYDLNVLKIDAPLKKNRQINLSYLLQAYQLFKVKDSFFLRPAHSNPKTFDYFFNKLAGNDILMWQIMNGKTEAEIRKSWEPALNDFKKRRKIYLLYPDFE